MIKAIMLDVDGVLVTGKSPAGEHWACTLSEDLGVDYSFLQAHLFNVHWELIVTGRAGLRDRLEMVLMQHASDITVDRIISYWFQNDAHINQELLKVLKSIRRTGLVVYLATNQEHERAAFLMNDLRLAAHVDGCHYSAAIGHRKPFPAFYHEVGRRVGLKPDELLLVDDSLQNVQAASSIGWRAAQWLPESNLEEIVRSALI
jgi:putative hydrolase of the HAD superfamily